MWVCNYHMRVLVNEHKHMYGTKRIHTALTEHERKHGKKEGKKRAKCTLNNLKCARCHQGGHEQVASGEYDEERHFPAGWALKKTKSRRRCNVRVQTILDHMFEEGRRTGNKYTAEQARDRIRNDPEIDPDDYLSTM